MQTFAQNFTTCSKIYARFSVSLQQIQNIMKKLLDLLGFLLIMALVAGGAIYYLLFTCPFQHTEKAYIFIDTDECHCDLNEYKAVRIKTKGGKQ